MGETGTTIAEVAASEPAKEEGATAAEGCASYF
jgi:hypothetical protein